MKKLLISIWLGSLVGSIPGFANASSSPMPSTGKEVEVGISNVFIPETGYDDNDRIEVVLTGTFLSPCYTLGRAYAETSPDGLIFSVHQMAWKWPGASCASGDLPMKDVHYRTPILLGQLDAKNYQVEHQNSSGVASQTKFQIKHAITALIDNTIYTAVRSISMDSKFSAGANVTAEIRGTLPGECYYFSQEPKVMVEGNVVVVLPSITYADNGDCGPSEKPFSRTIQIGALNRGDYLLHVRSSGGTAMYQEFSVR